MCITDKAPWSPQCEVPCPFSAQSQQTQTISLTQPRFDSTKSRHCQIIKQYLHNSLNFQLLGSWGSDQVQNCVSALTPHQNVWVANTRNFQQPFPPPVLDRAVTPMSHHLNFVTVAALRLWIAFSNSTEIIQVLDGITSRCITPGRDKHSSALGLCRNFLKTEENKINRKLSHQDHFWQATGGWGQLSKLQPQQGSHLSAQMYKNVSRFSL